MPNSGNIVLIVLRDFILPVMFALLDSSSCQSSHLLEKDRHQKTGTHPAIAGRKILRHVSMDHTYMCAIICVRNALAWGQHHDHLAAFHLRHGLDLGDVLGLVADPRQNIGAKFLMRHLAATEAQSDLHLVTT